MLGRQLEDQGDVDGAIAAFQRAMKLDPASADIPAELAGAVRAAEPRARVDRGGERGARDQPDARRSATACWGPSTRASPSAIRTACAPGGGQASYRQLAIDHLEKALKASSPMTAAGVRLTIARLAHAGVGVRQGDSRAPAVAGRRAVAAAGRGDAGAGVHRVRARRRAPSPCSRRRWRWSRRSTRRSPSAYEKDERWSDAAARLRTGRRRRARATRRCKTRWAFALLSMPDDAGAKRARDLLRRGDQGQPHRGVAAVPARPRAAGDRGPRRLGGERAPADGHQPRQHVGRARAGAGARSAAPVAGAHRGARAGRREAGARGAKPTPRSS